MTQEHRTRRMAGALTRLGAGDPLVGELLRGLTGVDLAGATNRFATNIDDTIWREIGVEEAAIRRDPQATRDPLIIGVFGTGAGY